MFKIGDRVWCTFMGWGEVLIDKTTNDNDTKLPLAVEFENGYIGRFTKDGRAFTNGLRCLFFEEIIVPHSALEKPRKTAQEMLDECEGIEFKYGEKNFFISKEYMGCSEVVSVMMGYKYQFIGAKYISKEDAERIVNECKENNQ